MISWRPLTYPLGMLLGLGTGDIAAAAVERWEIAPSETRRVPPVIILPGQAERITRTEFTTIPLLMQSLEGDVAEQIGPTTGYRLRDVDIVDGVMYSQGLAIHLRARRHRMALGRLADMGSGAFYETWVGNRWFGNWLLDDCLTYRLAETAGSPVTTMPKRQGHVPRYEELLELEPQRIGNAHFDEAIVFDDHANNSNRLARAQDMRHRVLTQSTAPSHPGVFLLRGQSGDQRVLENEDKIARHFADDFGFRVMFAENHSADDLMSACGSARVIAGVEGSQLNHGIVAMPVGGTLLTIQPPDRATTAMKLLTDRWQQRMAIVIGHGEAESFHVDWTDIAHTLDRIDAEISLNSSEQSG